MPPKGKKLWRKAIDTTELIEAQEKNTKAARKAVAVDKAPDSQLFFIDNAIDNAAAQVLSEGGSLKKLKRGPRPLKCQLIINSAHQAKAVNPAASKPKQPKGPAFKKQPQASAKRATSTVRKTANATDTTSSLDLWGNKIAPAEPATSKPERPVIRAVEVDAPGCSFNPDAEQHQDTVAEAVAAEMGKLYAKEHEPKTLKLFSHTPDMGALEALLDTGGNAESEEDEENPEELDLDEASLVARRQEKKTQAVRNRQKRQREAELAVQEKQDLKKQRRELDRLRDLNEEISVEQNAQAMQAARRAITKAEKALIEPPRLSKHKFQPAAIQVLLSEEIDGSLRRLKGTPMLTKDRFKTLQKRGVIEPRIRLEKTARRKAVTYQTGDRLEKAVSGNEEAQALSTKHSRMQKPASHLPKKGKFQKRR